MHKNLLFSLILKKYIVHIYNFLVNKKIHSTACLSKFLNWHPKIYLCKRGFIPGDGTTRKKKHHWNLLLGDGGMRTLSKNIKKWLRIFITLDIFYEEIRSFLGILLNCTSLFYVKSFCCWCPIISPIYSAMYVSNVWMSHFTKWEIFLSWHWQQSWCTKFA